MSVSARIAAGTQEYGTILALVWYGCEAQRAMGWPLAGMASGHAGGRVRQCIPAPIIPLFDYYRISSSSSVSARATVLG
jgi:hypothetical protein